MNAIMKAIAKGAIAIIWNKKTLKWVVRYGNEELAKKIEDFYKKPEDIEWAIVDGQVYLLQSRPITTMK